MAALTPELPPSCEPYRPVVVAIARAEGFYRPNSLPARFHNPLAVAGRLGYAQFPTAELGWAAGCAEVLRRVRLGARTIRQLACGGRRYGKWAVRCNAWARLVARIAERRVDRPLVE